MSPFIDTAIDLALTDDETRPAELLLPFQSEEASTDDWMYEDDTREYEYDRELITARMG